MIIRKVAAASAIQHHCKDDGWEAVTPCLPRSIPNTRLCPGAVFLNQSTVNRYQSVKLYSISGYDAHCEHDFQAFGIAWQYRWGGGY
jgi:hypothetical protein